MSSETKHSNHMPPYYSKQLMSDISLVQTLTRLCLRSYANSCAMDLTFVCNAADTSQASRRENRFSCVSLSSPSPSSSSLAIYRDYRPQGREKKRRKDDDRAQRNERSFVLFAVATFSSRNHRRAFFFLSVSFCAVAEPSWKAAW